MAAVFPGQVSAVQVGTYFVRQYYHVLQQQPHMGHQFYHDASTMMRIDGDTTETATSRVHIHSLLMALNFTGIEIKTANFMNSWDGGVLVMVSGFVQTRGYNTRRKFVQTFFLAPQDKGYFVLNDIFHFLDEENVLQHPSAVLAHNNLESNLTPSNPVHDEVSDYMLGGEIQSREFVDQVHAEENDTVNSYSIQQPQQQEYHYDAIADETPTDEPVAFSNTMNIRHDTAPSVEEHVGELTKHTYASILRVAKSGNSTPQPAPVRNPSPVASDWHQAPQSTQQFYPSVSKSSSEAVEEAAMLEEEVGEPLSVYVGNLHSSITESDLEHEFKKFGRLRPDGVAIRSRKETGIYYGFVEFDDLIGVQNALKASPILINGREIYVEERRPNSGAYRGGRRGRGRGSYHTDVIRGRFGGRGYGRASVQDNEREYNSRPRGNGLYQRVPRQDRVMMANQIARNGQHSTSEAA